MRNQHEFVQTLCYGVFDSPIGPLMIAADEQGLRHIVFAEAKQRPQPQEHWIQDLAAVAEPRRQLQAFLGAELREFDLPLAPSGTAFQMRAWQALSGIPYGETRSYSDQANAIGAPRAVRAIGAANGRNPLPIVVPCHRVIGSDGSLTGFGGGIAVKRWLLQLEAEGRSPPPL